MKTQFGFMRKNREYGKLILANVINRFGDSLDSIVFSLLVYQISNDVSWSALIFGVNMVPTIVLQPIFGAFVESLKKKQVMIAADLLRGILVGLIAVLYGLHQLTPMMMLVITVLISTVEAFRVPAGNAIVPQLLDQQSYEEGIAINTSLSRTAELIGLGMSGILVSFFGYQVVLLLDLATFIGSACVIARITVVDQMVTTVKVNFRAWSADFVSGFRYALRNKVLFTLCLFAAFLNAVIVPYNTLRVGYIFENFSEVALVTSALSICLTLGMLLGSYSYHAISKRLNKRYQLLVMGPVIGFAYLMMTVATTLKVSEMIQIALVSIVIFIIGFSVAIGGICTNVIFMNTVEKEYMARASSILGSISVLSIPLTSFLVSFIASFLSINTILLMFVIIILVIAVVSFNAKSLRQIQ